MATSGTIYGTTHNSNLTFRLDWNLVSQSAATRSSKVKLKWIMVRGTTATTTNKVNAPWTQTVDGTTTSGTVDFDIRNTSANTAYVWRTTTVTIVHDLDGTKTASVSGTLNLSGTSAGSCSLSGSMVLPQIAVTPPTATGLTYTDVGTGYSTVGAYVAGFTRFSFTATATQGDAPIASYSFYRGTEQIGAVNTSALTATYEMTFNEPSGSWIYSVVVADTAGNSSTYALGSAVNILAYTMPQITATTFRCDSGGTQDNEGTYGKVNMTYSVASVGSNSAQVHKCVINGSTYTSFPQIVSGLATSTTYSAEYTVTDKFGSTSSITQYVQVSFINFALYPSSSGGGASFGEKAQQDKFIVNHSDTTLRGDLTVEGRTSLAYPLPISEGGTGTIGFTASSSVVNTSTFSGATLAGQSWHKWGKVAAGVLTITGTIAAGANLTGSVANAWKPKQRCTGAGYYNQSPFIMMMLDDGTFTIRNASGSSRSPSNTTPLYVSITYLCAQE